MPQHTGRDITQEHYFINLYNIKYIFITYDKSSVSLSIFQKHGKIDGQQVIPAPDADSLNGTNLRVRQLVQKWYYSPTAYK